MGPITVSIVPPSGTPIRTCVVITITTITSTTTTSITSTTTLPVFAPVNGKSLFPFPVHCSVSAVSIMSISPIFIRQFGNYLI